MYSQRLHNDTKCKIRIYNQTTKMKKFAVIGLSKPLTRREWTDKEEKKVEEIFNSFWIELKFYPSCYEEDYLDQANIESKIKDLQNSLIDDEIDGIIIARWGRNSIQLLHHIDFNLFKKYKKIVIWFSDITIILNAIYSKTLKSSFHGPLLASFIDGQDTDITKEYFQKAIKTHENTVIADDDIQVIQNGTCKWTIVGGNLRSFGYLQGTIFFPNLEDKILILEDTPNEPLNARDRALHSLALQNNANKVKWILIWQNTCKDEITISERKKMFSQIPAFKDIPIMTNLKFGHISQNITLPIWGTISFNTKDKKIKIESRNF